jgi:DnaJ-class molecular chaperone
MDRKLPEYDLRLVDLPKLNRKRRKRLCPKCRGTGYIRIEWGGYTCRVCEGDGKINNNT